MNENLNNISKKASTIIEGLEYGDLSKNKVVGMLNDIKEETELAKSQLA